MLTDNWFPAFVQSGNDIALNLSQSAGDNPMVGKELNDLMQSVITPDNRVRCVFTEG